MPWWIFPYLQNGRGEPYISFEANIETTTLVAEICINECLTAEVTPTQLSANLDDSDLVAQIEQPSLEAEIDQCP